MTNRFALALIGAAAVGVTGCGGGSDPMTGPGGGSPTLMSVHPAGGAMGVPVGTSFEIDWGATMGAGMEQYVDLHRGNLSGPVVPMGYAWSEDHSTLICTPASPLQHGLQYVLHIGGGMVDADGDPVDMDMHGPAFGGQWIQGGMMGSGHGGMPWGMMGGGWQHGGTYGMAFTVTTG
jgi:hypothetical protein